MEMAEARMEAPRHGQERFLALLESANNAELFYGDDLSALETVIEESETELNSGSGNLLSNYVAGTSYHGGFVHEIEEDEPAGLRLISGLIEAAEPLDVDERFVKNSDVADVDQLPVNDTTWVRRHRRGAMPDERTIQAERVTTLESAIRGFAERKTSSVITPTLGMNYDSLTEAYNFYNLYSWETGLGIRYGKSRNNVKGARCMQEFVCCCSGKPSKENSSPCRTKCRAMVRLLRTDDGGIYLRTGQIIIMCCLIRVLRRFTFRLIGT
ncbi:hypothetical protein ACQJBY_053916 [Aegilops geniculata]